MASLGQKRRFFLCSETCLSMSGGCDWRTMASASLNVARLASNGFTVDTDSLR
jgi:hypothetical protein